MTMPSCQQCLHFPVPIDQEPCADCRQHHRRPAFVPAGPRAAPVASPAPLAPTMGNWRCADARAGRLRDDDEAQALGRVMRR